MLSEVEKLFYQDVQNKKRIGSNIFKRSSTRRGGVTQALKTPYYYMSNKEKKKLNGKVEPYNMYENILNINEFNNKTNDEKKMLLEGWRKRYPNQKIYNSMNISRQTYYNILHELQIKVGGRGRSKYEISDVDNEEFEKMKNDIVEYETFMTLPKDKKKILLDTYLNEMTQIELASFWKIKVSAIYNLTYQLKDKKKKKESVKKDIVASNPESQESYETIDYPSSPVVQKKSSFNDSITLYEADKRETENFFFAINQSGSAEKLQKKLQLLLASLDEDENYEISLKLRQV